MSAQPALRAFTVDEFHRMASSGILAEDDRVELLDGAIVEMSPIGSRHAACVKQLMALLSAGLEGRAILSVQDPVTLDDRSEPQPDLALLRPRDDFYAHRHPGPADILLVIEVADSSAAFDRDVKVPMYARAGIPETWLVDLGERHLERYREPHDGRYTVREILGAESTLEAPTGTRIEIAALLAS